MLKIPVLLSGVVLISALLPSVSVAERAVLQAKVVQIKEDPNLYGGCMVKLDKTIANNTTAPLDCPGDWVSLGCDGSFDSKDFAWHKFDLAKIAYTQKDEKGYFLILRINDAKKPKGGYCFAESVDLSNQATVTTNPK